MNDDGNRNNLQLLLNPAIATYTSHVPKTKNSGGYSPITDLAMNFGGLVTDSFDDTPKRRLSLSSAENTPVLGPLALRPVVLSKQLSADDGCCLESPTDPNSNSFGKGAFGLKKCDELALEQKSSAFRRFKSLQSPFCGLDASPCLLPRPALLARTCSPHKPSSHRQTTPEKPRPIFSFCDHDVSPLSPGEPAPSLGRTGIIQLEDECSQDSGLGLDKDFKDKQFSPFAKPVAPPPRRLNRVLSDETNSPRVHSPVSPKLRRSSTPSLTLALGTEACISPVKLRQSSLTLSPEADDGDDGFLELEDLDDQDEGMPSCLQGLLSNPVLSMDSHDMSHEQDPTPTFSRKSSVSLFRDNAENIEPKSALRRGLFRSPSAPNIKARQAAVERRRSIKRSERSPDENESPLVIKRRRSVFNCSSPQKVLEKRPLPRSSSEAMIKSCLDSSSDSDNMLGDFSKPHCLPTIPGKHRDLKCISPETLARLQNNEFDELVEKTVIVDCRFPYEYQGGHIRDALNLWERDSIMKEFLTAAHHRTPMDASHKRKVIVFHCEFSSERGPKMYRFLRQMDRDANKECYPALHYPEIYLLEGGYKAFFHSHMELCQPKTYLPMSDERYLDDLKHFRAKSKSWAGERSHKGARPGLRQLKL